MKKQLSIFSLMALTALTASSVVACAGRSINALNDFSYILETKENDYKYDIMKWSSDAVGKDKYKEYFVDAIKDTKINDFGGDTSYLQIAEGVKKIGDKYTAESSDYPVISTLLMDFQNSSNTKQGGKTIGGIEAFNSLNYQIYDMNQPLDTDGEIQPLGTIISEYTGGHDGKLGSWKSTNADPSKPSGLKAIENKDTNVYMFHFKVSITTNEDDENFIGSRENIVEESKNDKLAAIYAQVDEKNRPTTDAYDYRFDIQFIISIT